MSPDSHVFGSSLPKEDPNVINKILSRDWNYIVDAVMWPKFGNSGISVREVTTTSIQGFDPRKLFLRSGLGSSSIIWDWH